MEIFPTVAAILGSELPATTAPDGESFLNVVRGQRKPGPARRGVVLREITASLDKAALDAADGVPGNLRALFVRVTVAKP